MTELNSSLSTAFSEISTDSGPRPKCQEQKVSDVNQKRSTINLIYLDTKRDTSYLIYPDTKSAAGSMT